MVLSEFDRIACTNAPTFFRASPDGLDGHARRSVQDLDTLARSRNVARRIHWGVMICGVKRNPWKGGLGQQGGITFDIV